MMVRRAPWGARIRQGLRSEQALAGATTLGFVLMRLLVLELAARRIDPEGFGLFVANRRWVATLQPLWMVGLSLIIIRWVSQRRLTQGMLDRIALQVVGATACGVALSVLAPVTTSRVLFGDVPPTAQHGMWLALGAGGMSLYTVVQVALQGLGHFRRMHAWQLVVGGLGPALAVGGWPVPSATAFIVLSLAIDWTAVFAAWVWVRRQLPAGPVTGFSVRIGLPQVPASLGLSLLLNAPTMVATQLLGIAVGGQFAVGTMLVGLIGNLFAAMHRRVVTVAARAARAGRRTRLHGVASAMVRPTILAAAAVLGLGWAAAFWVVRQGWVHPPGPLGAAAVMLSLGAIPYACYVAMRGLVDGASDLPLNAKAILWGWCAFALAAPLGWWGGPLGVATAGTWSMAVLAWATYRQAAGHRLRAPLPTQVTRHVAAELQRWGTPPAG